MTIAITPIILCGGSGTRLWPLSRITHPKQFLSLYGHETLFQQAVNRLESLSSKDMVCHTSLIVTNDVHRFLVLDQLRELTLNVEAKILLEPEGRNTAPALTLAALEAVESDENTILVVTPSDHVIEDFEAFQNAMIYAIREAHLGAIVTLGIKPHSPDTGYGYIRYRKEGVSHVFDVTTFQEKPDLATAESYVKAGDYLWNAGMFIVKARVWLEAMHRCRPDILVATQLAFHNKKIDGLFVRPDPVFFKKIPSESIDYAVMEPATSKGFQVKVAELNAGWDDLGGWNRVRDVNLKNQGTNVTRGDIHEIDSHHNLILSHHRLVTTVGVNNLIIIETPDAILVADQSKAESVKTLVQALTQKARTEVQSPRKVYRPWGWFDTMEEGLRFKVKRISVKPGASLSLQRHHHRSEHWVVIEGEATITSNDKTFTLRVNESTYIPQGQLHRLSNASQDKPLEIIEVQSGSYVGEDDIERINDEYGRTHS
jgi:mannose-1-phosphate guanylyltransferase/mannose-6-phosphate isomerase